VNEKSIQLFIRLALTMLSIAKDWADTSDQPNSEVVKAVRAKAGAALKAGEELLASLPQG